MKTREEVKRRVSRAEGGGQRAESREQRAESEEGRKNERTIGRENDRTK